MQFTGYVNKYNWHPFTYLLTFFLTNQFVIYFDK